MQSQTAGNNTNTNTNTKNPLNYGNLPPQNRIYQSFCGDFFSIILMVFIIRIRLCALFYIRKKAKYPKRKANFCIEKNSNLEIKS